MIWWAFIPRIYEFKSRTWLTAGSHPFKVEIVRCNRTFYAQVLFTRTSRAWNTLPDLNSKLTYKKWFFSFYFSLSLMLYIFSYFQSFTVNDLWLYYLTLCVIVKTDDNDHIHFTTFQLKYNMWQYLEIFYLNIFRRWTDFNRKI